MNLETLITSVLMVGHSLFGQDNPAMLEQLLRQSSSSATVEAQIINGAPLSYNWEHGDSAEGVNARERLQTPVDAVILTEGLPLANHLKWSNTEETVTRYYQLAKDANPDAAVYLQETWHSLSSGTGTEVPFDEGADIAWRDRLEQDLPRWQAVVDEVNDSVGGDMRLLPAGQAMARLDDAIRAGTVPGLTEISEVFSDDIHPNSTGFYYISALQYAVLTGHSPVGLPHRLQDRWGKAYPAPEPALARRLQEIAWAAAQGEEVRTAALPPDPPPLPSEPAAPRLNEEVAASAPAPGNTAKAPPRQPIAMNLMEVADWSPQAPFLDHFKTARPWIGHLPGRWGGVGHDDLAAAGYLDPQGWPTAMPPELGSIGTVILTDLPASAHSLAGRYVLRFDGSGIVEVSGRAENVRYGKGKVTFDYTPGPGPVEIRIQRTGRGTDYVRNITVVRADQLKAYADGALFNPLWLDMLDGFDVLRFMDWMQTNDSEQVGWEDRPEVSDYTWARKGVPAEILLALANTLGADPWFNMPHMADDSYLRNFAQLVDGGLDEDLRAYVEYSNEVWNWQFAQAQWADEQARSLWAGSDLWMQFYGGRAAEMSRIWTDVFGADADQRLVRVISSQTGWPGLEEQVLNAPLWVAGAPDRLPPARYFDAYAITGYFGGTLGLRDSAPMVRAWIADSRDRARAAAADLGLQGAEAAAYIEAHQYDVATAQAMLEIEDGLLSEDGNGAMAGFLDKELPYHKSVADEYGLDLIMYEGGSHVVGVGQMVEDAELTGFFTHFNYTEEMAALYTKMLTGWAEHGGTLFAAYADVAVPGKWGSWGARRTLSDNNPRWRVLESVK